MVCCIIIATLLGLLMRPLLAVRSNPMAWRLGVAETAKRAHGRAQSIRHALEGLRFLTRNEPNMRIHLGAALGVVAAGLWMGLGLAQWRWLIFAIAMVLMAEAFNTAVEQASNAVTGKFDPAIKAAKDVAASAVLIATLAAALIGASIFGSHLVAAPDEATAVYCGSPRIVP